MWVSEGAAPMFMLILHPDVNTVFRFMLVFHRSENTGFRLHQRSFPPVSPERTLYAYL